MLLAVAAFAQKGKKPASGYDIIHPFKNGIAKVEKDKKQGFIRADGDEFVPVKYDQIYGFDYAQAMLDGAIKRFKNDDNIILQSADAADLPVESTQVETASFRLPSSGLDWEALEKDLLSQALEMAQGNRSRAARLLNLPYKAFLYRIEKHGIDGNA